MIWLLCIIHQPLEGDFSRSIMAGVTMDDTNSEPYAIYVGRYREGTSNSDYVVAAIVGNLPGLEEDQYLEEATVVDSDSKNQVALEGFEILAYGKDDVVIWEPIYPDYDLPVESISFGETKAGEKLYIGRIQDFYFPGTTVIGKIDMSTKRFSFAGKEGLEVFHELQEFIFGEVEILTVVQNVTSKI